MSERNYKTGKQMANVSNYPIKFVTQEATVKRDANKH